MWSTCEGRLCNLNFPLFHLQEPSLNPKYLLFILPLVIHSHLSERRGPLIGWCCCCVLFCCCVRNISKGQTIYSHIHTPINLAFCPSGLCLSKLAPLAFWPLLLQANPTPPPPTSPNCSHSTPGAPTQNNPMRGMESGHFSVAYFMHRIICILV